MAMIEELFSEYANIARKADYLFRSIQEKYPMSVKCRARCCDCCHAIFGVFPIEAAYINYHFNRLERKARRDVLRRSEKAEAEMLKAKEKLKVFEEDPKMKVFGLGKQRVRCPLLQDSEECVLYENRPIICRVYGVPYTLKRGDKEVSYVCGISNFEEKASYPAVKLDNIYHELVRLSTELLAEAGYLNPAAKADLMLPLARVLRMPFEEIMKGNFGE
jgi:Fe-S-cluster containining protein